MIYGQNKRNAPQLNPRQRKHLLMQYTTAAASCVGLIFYLFDKMQRHGVINSVYAKTQDKEKWDEFVRLYTSCEFQAKLEKAAAAPHSPVGREVTRILTPMISSTGKVSGVWCIREGS